MNLEAARRLSALLGNSYWLERTRAFAASLRTAGHSAGGLLLVGTPADEPWHLAAHLDDAARLAGRPELSPTLVRHRVPPGAAPHLAVDLSRLHTAAKGQTVLVVAPTAVPTGLLSRLDDARHAGATILAIDAGDHDLQTLAHDALTIDEPSTIRDDCISFDTAQHLVTIETADNTTTQARHRQLARLNRLLNSTRGS